MLSRTYSCIHMYSPGKKENGFTKAHTSTAGACEQGQFFRSRAAGARPESIAGHPHGARVAQRRHRGFLGSNFLIASKQHLFKSNRGAGGRRRQRIGNRKSLLGAVAVRARCDVAHQAALERRPPRHPSSPLHAATAASAKDASRDRRLAQPPRTCPDSDAWATPLATR